VDLRVTKAVLVIKDVTEEREDNYPFIVNYLAVVFQTSVLKTRLTLSIST
jgi:hypothetical protein